MLMIFAVLLCYLYKQKGKKGLKNWNCIVEVRVRVPFRPFFRYCCSSIAKLRRTITLNLFSIRSSNEISLIWSHISTIYGLIIDPHDNQLPVGLTAQLVEHCTGIAEGRVQVLFGPFFRYSLSGIAKIPRSLTLKLFPSAVQMKFH